MPLPDAAAAACGFGPPVKLLVALTRIGSLIQRKPGYLRKSTPALIACRPRSHDADAEVLPDLVLRSLVPAVGVADAA